MKYLKVNLWGHEIGRLVWDSTARRSYFMYNPDAEEPMPDVAPLLSPVGKRNVNLPVYGIDGHIYQGLPPFIADSLPDSWGNTLFDRWVRDNKIPHNRVTPLYKLMFIGSRGMGALEYEPAAADLMHSHHIDIKALHEMSLKVLEGREKASLAPDEAITLQALLAVGTSAGGRQMKAIVAIDRDTGEIRSGQNDSLEGFEYCILKFGDTSMPLAEIEAAYYHMAKDAGIYMEECSLFAVEGVNHFLTRRFDRKGGRKVHVQTLAAINPEARSYEDIIATCRALGLPEREIEQMYRRMVFNIMSNNTDDHSKNLSFMLEQGGHWHLAPAYDMTFIFNSSGTGPNVGHRMSVCAKTAGITRADLLEFASMQDIRNAKAVIDSVAASLSRFEEYAQATGIAQPWRAIIAETLSKTLVEYGYDNPTPHEKHNFCDGFGRVIKEARISVDSKGSYALSAIIDGVRRRRFIRKNMDFFREIKDADIRCIPPEMLRCMVEKLLPPA